MKHKNSQPMNSRQICCMFVFFHYAFDQSICMRLYSDITIELYLLQINRNFVKPEQNVRQKCHQVQHDQFELHI